MLDQICGHIHNWFTDAADVHPGEYRIEGGVLTLPFMQAGRYFRVVGSAFNDGVYRYPAEDLTDEVFAGEIWAMKPPRELLALAEEIAAWQTQYGAAAAAPFKSENVIGVYSYTREDGAGGSWREVFGPRLNRWRKLA